jgi:tetratricopeptide (TPR) repeat protein
MKTIILTLSIVSLGLASAAQQSQYQSAMHGILESLDLAGTQDDYTQCANRFERIAAAEKTLWLPYYYASYSLIVMSFEEELGDRKDLILDRAQELLDKAMELEPEESELYVLQAFLYPSRILVDPMNRGIQYMELIYASLEKAKALNPDNPRIYFLEGVNKANLPPAMGGGAEAARPILETAVAKFESFDPDDPLWPDWGAEAAKTELDKLL